MDAAPLLKNHRRRGHAVRRERARAPQTIERGKTAAFVYGQRTSERVRDAMRDVLAIKKPHVVQLTRKHEMLPMEDAAELEHLLGKSDAGLFLFGNDSKKRPDNLVLGRTFDGRVLDMIELGITFFESMQAVQRRTKAGTAALNTAPPMLVFRGEAFANAPDGSELATLRSLLLDFFRGQLVSELDLEALDMAIVFSTVVRDSDKKLVVTMRTYRADFAKSSAGTSASAPSETRRATPAVSLVEHGPHLDLEIRRSVVAAPNLAKLARKQARLVAVTKKRKNVEHDRFQGKLGRIHIKRQDVNKVVQQSRFRKALKRGKAERDGEGAEDQTRKRARRS